MEDIERNENLTETTGKEKEPDVEVGTLPTDTAKQSAFWPSVWLFAACWLLYAFAYCARSNFSSAVETMQKSGVLDDNLAGIISATYFICYACGQIINGILADKRNPAALVCTGLSLMVLANLAMAFLYTPPFMLVFWWGLNGIGQSMLWAPVFYISTNLLEQRVRFAAISLNFLTTPFGKVTAYFVSSQALKAGWQGAFYVSSAVIFGVLVFFFSVWLSTRKRIVRPIVSAALKSGEKTEKSPFFTMLIVSGLIIGIPAMIVHGLFINGIVEWIPTILQSSYGMTDEHASLLSMIIPAVGVLGLFVCNFCYKRFQGKELATAASFMFATIVPIGAMLILALNMGNWGLAFESVAFIVLYGLAYIIQLAYNHLMLSLVPIRFNEFGLGATVTGVVNAVNYGGSAIATYAMARLVKAISLWQMIIIWLAALVVGGALLAIASIRWRKFVKTCKPLGKIV